MNSGELKEATMGRKQEKKKKKTGVLNRARIENKGFERFVPTSSLVGSKRLEEEVRRERRGPS